MNQIVGKFDIVLITLDALRFDVAEKAYRLGVIPSISRWMEQSWERRHTPGNFTYAAHQAFFAGFLPTPIGSGPHLRLFASAFPGSETTGSHTFQFAEENIVAALAARHYRTICVGGVGFFNKQTRLGSVLPELFQESYWSVDFGVTCRESTDHQVKFVEALLRQIDPSERVFLFLNVSATHQPNYFYLEGATDDSTDSQLAALSYADAHLANLFAAFRRRGETFCIVCSDHGTAYGEDGFRGHRLNHTVVGEVPYTDFVLPPIERSELK